LLISRVPKLLLLTNLESLYSNAPDEPDPELRQNLRKLTTLTIGILCRINNLEVKRAPFLEIPEDVTRGLSNLTELVTMQFSSENLFCDSFMNKSFLLLRF
jgi:hypothetical protein